MANKTFQKTLLGCSIALMSAFVAGNASAAKKVDDTYSKLNQCIGYYNQSQYTQATPVSPHWQKPVTIRHKPIWASCTSMASAPPKTWQPPPSGITRPPSG